MTRRLEFDPLPWRRVILLMITWWVLAGTDVSILAAALGTPTQARTLWALQALKAPAIPFATNTAWPLTPIDCFVVAALEENGLRPAPPADKATLLRRATFDLHGLPPTVAELDQFLADETPDAFARVVERLLASPRYGERWARHWLDLARFAESDGFEYDKMRENAWPYRDYVIESFNRDLPYAQFVREQIAGDALEPRTRLGLAAPGFLIAGAYDEAGNSSKSDLLRARIREEELEDVIASVSQTFLGLTINCARCHDHKFDPISQRDYYRLKAVFEGTGRGQRPWATASDIAQRQEQIRTWQREITNRTERLQKLEETARRTLESGGDRNLGAVGTPGALSTTAVLSALSEEGRNEYQRLQKELKKLRDQTQQHGPLPQVYSVVSKPLSPTFVLARGDVERKQDAVTAGGLSALTALNADFGLNAMTPETERRLRWAEWLVDPANPLPSRVMANRIWQHHFGRGLVATPNDFGVNGGQPSHPALLDYLATEFQRTGGSVKSLHRCIMLSRVYQQAGLDGLPARQRAAAEALDAENRLLWHFSLRRLEAEAVRDAMLMVSGELNDEMFGQSFRPFTVTISGSHFYHLEDRETAAFNRRTIYRMNVQSAKEPLLDSLDCPDPATKTPVRSITTTPIQALGLMNSTFVQRQAERFAKRLKRESATDATAQVDLGYRLALGRAPRGEETRRAIELIKAQDLTTFCWALLNASELIYFR